MSSQGQADCKSCSLICTSAVRFDTSSMELDYFAHDGQPQAQTRSFRFWGTILLPESIEYKRQEFGVDALPSVRHGALDITAAPRHPQRNGSASRSKLHGIV